MAAMAVRNKARAGAQNVRSRQRRGEVSMLRRLRRGGGAALAASSHRLRGILCFLRTRGAASPTADGAAHMKRPPIGTALQRHCWVSALRKAPNIVT